MQTIITKINWNEILMNYRVNLWWSIMPIRISGELVYTCVGDHLLVFIISRLVAIKNIA